MKILNVKICKEYLNGLPVWDTPTNLNIDASVSVNSDVTVAKNVVVKGHTAIDTLSIDDNILVTNAKQTNTPYTGLVSITGNKVNGIKLGKNYFINTDFLLEIGLTSSYSTSLKSDNIIISNGLNEEDAVESYSGNRLDIIVNSNSQTANITLFKDSDKVVDILAANSQGVRWLFDGIGLYIKFETNASPVLVDNSTKNLLKSYLLKNIEFTEYDEAYATAVYNTESNEIQLGLGYVNIDPDTNEKKFEFAFGAGENQAIATRDSNLDFGDILTWDPATNKIVALTGLKSLNGEIVALDTPIVVKSNYSNEEIGLINGAFLINNPDDQIITMIKSKGISVLDATGTEMDYQLPDSLDDMEFEASPDNTRIFATREWVAAQNFGSALNLENGDGEGSIAQIFSDNKDKNPKATGLGAVALGGLRGDKKDEDIDADDVSTIAEGVQAFATGAGTYAKGNWSATFGKDTKAFGRQSIAGGGGTQAGRETDANNTFIAAFAMGELCKALARGSAAFGLSTTANGEYSLAIGSNTNAEATGSFTQGYKTHASGMFAIAAGDQTWAPNDGSAAFGQYTRTGRKYQFVTGICNVGKDNTLFEIGIGTSDVDRKNAFEVLTDGRAKVYGTPQEDDDVVRKFDLNGKLDKLEGSSYKSRVYGTNYKGEFLMRSVAEDRTNSNNGTLAMYVTKNLGEVTPNSAWLKGEPKGSLFTCMPLHEYQATPKKYVDDNFGKTTLWKHTFTYRGGAWEDGSGYYTNTITIIANTETPITWWGNGAPFMLLPSDMQIISIEFLSGKTAKYYPAIKMLGHSGQLSGVYYIDTVDEQAQIVTESFAGKLDDTLVIDKPTLL